MIEPRQGDPDYTLGGAVGRASFQGLSLLSILTSLSDALELRFPFLSGHSNRVRDLSTRIGERMGLAKADLTVIHRPVVQVSNQFSSLRPATLENSPTLSVTSVHPRDRVWAAIK